MAKKNAPAPKVLPGVTNSFAGGMVTSFNPEVLPQDCHTRLQNVVLDTLSADKRNGYTKLNAVELAAASAVRSVYIGQGTTGVGRKVIAISGNKIYSIDPDTGTATERATGLNTSQRWDFTEGTLSGTARIVMVAPNNAPYQWDGAAASASTFTGPATNGDYVMYHASRLWIADGDLRTLYSSKIDVMSTWDSLDNIIVGKEEDGPITRIVSMGRYAVIFMQRAVYLLYGNRIRHPRNIALEKINLEDGCPAPWSVTKINNMIFFVGNEAFYVLIGRNAKKISRSIEVDFDTINKGYIDICQGTRQGNMWWVSVPYGAAQTTNNRTYVIHWNLPANDFGDFPITYFTGLAGNCFTYHPNTRKTYLGSSSQGFVYYYDTSLYADDSVAIDYDIITRANDFGDPFLEKVLTKIQVQVDVVASGSLAVSAGENEIAVGSFTTAATSPIDTGTTGFFMGDYGGESAYTRNGIVNYPIVPASGGTPLIGTWFRYRLRDNSTTNMSIRRIYSEAIPKAR